MKTLFQTGTPITSENMNLAHLSNSKPGVLNGCEVYEDENSLVISSGCVQFNDGSIVYLDGTDKLQINSLAHNEYYVYIIRYGNDFSIEISIILPEEYEYIILANVILSDNLIKIINSKKSTSLSSEKIIDGCNLHPNFLIFDDTALTVVFDKNDFTQLKSSLRVQVNDDSFIGIPFTYPNFSVSKVKIKAKLSSDTKLKLELYCDGKSVFINDGVITQNEFDARDEYVFDLQDSTKNINSGDCCALKLLLGQSTSEENINSDIVIYSLTLQT